MCASSALSAPITLAAPHKCNGKLRLPCIAIPYIRIRNILRIKVVTVRLCACPVCWLQAYTAAKKGDDVASTQALFQLANLLMRLPIIEPSSSQVELIADELKGWADRDILLRLQEVLLQVLEDPKQQQVVTGMLGL